MSTSPTRFRLAARLDEVGFSDIVKVRNRIMELRAAGATVYQFEGGEPFIFTPDYIKEAMARALAENKTRYAPSSGIPELRAAIADKLRERNRIPVSEEDVVVLNGGMQGLFGAFQSVVNPGDEVLVFSPYWTPIKDLIAHCEGTTVLVPTAEARRDGFAETLARYSTPAHARNLLQHADRTLPASSSRAPRRRRSRALPGSATSSSSPTKPMRIWSTTASTSPSPRSTGCLSGRSPLTRSRSLTR